MSEIEDLKISDILHVLRQVEVISARPDDSIKVAMETLVGRGLRSLPIVEGKKIIGVASAGDFIERGWNEDLDPYKERVSVIMTPGKKLKVVYLETKVLDALAILEEHKITHLPVLDEERLLVGFLSFRGILSAMNEIASKEEYFESQKRIMAQAM